MKLVRLGLQEQKTLITEMEPPHSNEKLCKEPKSEGQYIIFSVDELKNRKPGKIKEKKKNILG